MITFFFFLLDPFPSFWSVLMLSQIPSCNDFLLSFDFSKWNFHQVFMSFFLPSFHPFNDLTIYFSFAFFQCAIHSPVPKSCIQPRPGFRLQHRRPAFFVLNLADFRVSLHPIIISIYSFPARKNEPKGCYGTTCDEWWKYCRGLLATMTNSSKLLIQVNSTSFDHYLRCLLNARYIPLKPLSPSLFLSFFLSFLPFSSFFPLLFVVL